MPHIVAEPCHGCKNTVCVTVCPVDAFREDEQCLWIDPDECIDCGACVPECPVEAIFPLSLLPKKWDDYVQRNAERSRVCPMIMESKEPLSG